MTSDYHRHFKIYKPYGYLSQFITNQRKGGKHKLLGELGDFPEGTMSIGRLDKDSEGLLLLTTNGKLSTKVTAGNSEKEYYVQVDGDISEEAIESIALKALKRDTGARGLRSIIEKVLIDNMFDLPDMENVEEVIVNKDVVEKNKSPLIMFSDNQKKVKSSIS